MCVCVFVSARGVFDAVAERVASVCEKTGCIHHRAVTLATIFQDKIHTLVIRPRKFPPTPRCANFFYHMKQTAHYGDERVDAGRGEYYILCDGHFISHTGRMLAEYIQNNGHENKVRMQNK